LEARTQLISQPLYLNKLIYQVDEIKAQMMDINFFIKGAQLFNKKNENSELDEYKTIQSMLNHLKDLEN